MSRGAAPARAAIHTLGRLDWDLVKDGNLDAGHVVDEHLDLVLRDRRDALDDLIAAIDGVRGEEH